MGSGDWFKNIIGLKKSKTPNKRGIINLANGASTKNPKFRHLTQDVAATKIQSAYRAFRARKALRRLKGVDRVRGVIGEGHYSVKNQTSSALNHIHFWSKIQSEIRDRWLGMVVESRARQKKLENQLKLEAKIHEFEVEWSCSSETMEEVLNKIQQRETAAAKRERTLAYAFSHQWRANSNQYFGQSYYDLSKDSWGWSWKERWAAVRPWEKRYQTRPTLVKKVETKNKTSEVTNSTTSAKLALSNFEVSINARRSPKVNLNNNA